MGEGGRIALSGAWDGEDEAKLLMMLKSEVTLKAITQAARHGRAKDPPWLDSFKLDERGRTFWGAFEAVAGGKQCLERLMRCAAEYRVYWTLVGWIVGLRKINDLLAKWKVSFEDENIVGGEHDDVQEHGETVDAGGPHRAVLGLFFRASPTGD